MKLLPQEARNKAKRFLAKLKKEDDVASLLNLLNRTGEAFIFGGAVRDVVLGVPSQVVDLDIVVAGRLDVRLIESSFGALRRTKFGGFRLALRKYEVDFWELEESYTLRSYPRMEVDVGRLLKNVCFSTDAIAIGTSQRKVVADHAFYRAYTDRMLDFVVDPGTIEPKVLTRIARLATKHNLEMSAKVASYFVRGIEEVGAENVLSAERAWGKFSFLNDIQLESLRTDLNNAIEKAFKVCSLPP